MTSLAPTEADEPTERGGGRRVVLGPLLGGLLLRPLGGRLLRLQGGRLLGLVVGDVGGHLVPPGAVLIVMDGVWMGQMPRSVRSTATQIRDSHVLEVLAGLGAAVHAEELVQDGASILYMLYNMTRCQPFSQHPCHATTHTNSNAPATAGCSMKAEKWMLSTSAFQTEMPSAQAISCQEMRKGLAPHPSPACWWVVGWCVWG